MEGIIMLRKFLSSKKFKEEDDDYMSAEDEYVELNSSMTETGSQKVIVRPFVIEDFADVKKILDVLREGKTVCLLNIKPLREKDIIELKRLINKVKKTVEAVSGDIAGFGEDYIIVVPSFAKIHRDSVTDELEE